MGTIVVGVDESPSAKSALRWAVREGDARGWTVKAVLAWTYLQQHHIDADTKFEPDYGSAQAAEALSRIVTDTLGDDAAGVEQETICDLPVPGLLRAAEGADLLVVGARGIGGFRGLLLGSVSQQCAHHTPIPLVVVREPEAGLDEHGRIVVAVDGSSTSLRALRWALDAARARKAPLTVVHAWRPIMLAAIDYSAPIVDIDAFATAGQKVVDDALAEVDLSGLPAPIERLVVEGAPARSILDAATDASLIVVGSRGRGGFAGLLLGSVSQHVITHAACPVVVVPPAERGVTPEDRDKEETSDAD
jgi:nucleotide-binding universal stress UspA family protein